MAKTHKVGLPRTAAGQFQAAKRLILKAKKQSDSDLVLMRMPKLAALPKEIGDLTNLKTLIVLHTDVNDLRPLSRLTALNRLHFRVSPVKDLAPLVDLVDLETLNVQETLVSDLAPVENFQSLISLILDSTRVFDLAPLKKASALQVLFLRDTVVSDLGPLAGLTNLRHLSLERSQVTDILPVAKLRGLQTLSLEGTRVADFAPLAELTELEGLSLAHTKIVDLSVLAGLKNLKRLVLHETEVTDLSPLSDLTALQRLSLSRTRVSDLSPIQGLSLVSLGLENTGIDNLGPLARMTSLQEGALQTPQGFEGGIFFRGSRLEAKPPFDQLAKFDQPRRTIEVINAVRRQVGLGENIPTKADEEDDDDDPKQLAQRPASHSFLFQKGKIEAQAHNFAARHPDVAADIRTVVNEKARETSARLGKCNAPKRVILTVERLEATLGNSLSEVRAGILQMRFRSLEADLAAYDTDVGRSELPDYALAMLRDLTSSVEDLMGCFPQLADIEAERLAHRLKEADVPDIMQALAQIRQVAEENDLVARSARDALKVGEQELEHDAEIIYSGASNSAQNAAKSARDRTVGYMLLVYRNFLAGVVKTGDELVSLGSETWKGVREKGPEQLSNAAVSLTVAALVNALLGPAAAVGAFALSFKPLRERAKRVADKIAVRAKSADHQRADREDAV